MNKKKLEQIEQIETAAAELQSWAANMRKELAMDSAEIEKINQAIGQAPWSFFVDSLSFICGVGTACPIRTRWLRIPELDESIKTFLQNSFPQCDPDQLDSYLPDFNAPRIQWNRGNLRLHFDSVEEILEAVQKGKLSRRLLLQELEPLVCESREQIRLTEARLKQAHSDAATIDKRLDEIKRLPGYLPDESYAEAFERRWGELSRYNSTFLSRGEVDPQLKARMLRQQAAYNRLQANGLDYITEEPDPKARQYYNRDWMVESAARMEKMADDLDQQVSP